MGSGYGYGVTMAGLSAFTRYTPPHSPDQKLLLSTVTNSQLNRTINPLASTYEMGPLPDSPKMTLRKEADATPVVEPLDIEMNQISSVMASAPPDSQDEAQSPPDNGETTHSAVPALDQIQTIWNPYKNRFRVLSCCFMALGMGTNDSAAGALIASIEK